MQLAEVGIPLVFLGRQISRWRQISSHQLISMFSKLDLWDVLVSLNTCRDLSPSIEEDDVSAFVLELRL